MTEFENEEKARAAQEPVRRLHDRGGRGTRSVEAALRTYLSAEQYRRQRQSHPPGTETPEQDDSPE